MSGGSIWAGHDRRLKNLEKQQGTLIELLKPSGILMMLQIVGWTMAIICFSLSSFYYWNLIP